MDHTPILPHPLSVLLDIMLPFKPSHMKGPIRWGNLWRNICQKEAWEVPNEAALLQEEIYADLSGVLQGRMMIPMHGVIQPPFTEAADDLIIPFLCKPLKCNAMLMY